MSISSALPQSTEPESHQSKPRTRSSPARIASPAKPSSPVMKSPEMKVPRLNFARSLADDSPASTHDSGRETGLPSNDSVSGVPASPSGISPQVRFAASSTVIVSSSAPSTPRLKSRHTEEMLSPRRYRIDSSPRKTPDWRKRADDAFQIAPSPRRLSHNLIHLGTEVAKLVFTEMRAKNPVLTKATINQLGRFETLIPIDKLSPDLRSRIHDDGSEKISHAKLIKAIFLPLLTDSEVGKTLLTMRRVVMEQYEGDSLTLVDREMREAEDPGFKSRLLMNIEAQGQACANIALGLKAPTLAASKLPPELIAFWKAMDAELCSWAQKNVALAAVDLNHARANLGFDLLFTRLLLPIASGPKEDASLAIPSMFFDSVKRALLASWPMFVVDFVRTVDAECSSKLNGSSSSTSSTSATPISTATPVSSEPQSSTGVIQE